MFRPSIILFLGIAAHLTAPTVAQNPNAAFRLGKPGLDLVASTLVQNIRPWITLPPQLSQTIGTASVTARNPYITVFTTPSLAYTLAAPNEISGTLLVSRVNVAGLFIAVQQDTLQQQSGNFIFGASDLSVAFTLNLAAASNNAPALNLASCTASTGSASLSLTSTQDPAQLSAYAAQITPYFNQRVCTTLAELVDLLNQKLYAGPSVLPNNIMTAGMQYQMQPEVTPDYVQFNFFVTNTTQPYPLVATPAAGSASFLFARGLGPLFRHPNSIVPVSLPLGFTMLDYTTIYFTQSNSPNTSQLNGYLALANGGEVEKSPTV